MMQSYTRSARNKGFTLIELLVVIAITAILAAILFPTFARAREDARRISCQSNLKQSELGLHQYTQDYDERFPGWYIDRDGSGKYTSSNPIGPTSDQGETEQIQPGVAKSNDGQDKDDDHRDKTLYIWAGDRNACVQISLL